MRTTNGKNGMFLTCTNGVGTRMRSNWHLGRCFQMLEGRSSSWLMRLGSHECCLQKCLQTTGSRMQLSGRSFAPTWLQTHSQSQVLVWIQNEQSKGRRHETQVSNWLPEISSCKHNFWILIAMSDICSNLQFQNTPQEKKKDFKSSAINTFGL